MVITDMDWMKLELCGQQESYPNPLTEAARRYFKIRKADKIKYERDA